MELSDEQIADFQFLYEKHFGVRPNKREAMEYGIELVNLMKAVYSPVTQRDLEKLPNLYATNTSRPADTDPQS